MIKKDELRQIDYTEFGEILRILTDKVIKSGIKIDLIVPILRSGAITGMHLASKLAVSNMLPAQYKYIYEPKEHIDKKFEFPKLNFSVPDNVNILVVDSNTVYGGIAQKVIDDVKNAYPKSKIYFASANLDASLGRLNNIEETFYGTISNESRKLKREEADIKGITNDIIIFPWEDLEEQWIEINSSQQQFES